MIWIWITIHFTFIWHQEHVVAHHTSHLQWLLNLGLGNYVEMGKNGPVVEGVKNCIDSVFTDLGCSNRMPSACRFTLTHTHTHGGFMLRMFWCQKRWSLCGNKGKQKERTSPVFLMNTDPVSCSFLIHVKHITVAVIPMCHTMHNKTFWQPFYNVLVVLIHSVVIRGRAQTRRLEKWDMLSFVFLLCNQTVLRCMMLSHVSQVFLLWSIQSWSVWSWVLHTVFEITH